VGRGDLSVAGHEQLRAAAGIAHSAGRVRGPLFSLAGSYIKAHFESRENGKPNSLVNMGTGLGLAVGYPFVGYLVVGHNWETSFHVLGLINVPGRSAGLGLHAHAQGGDRHAQAPVAGRGRGPGRPDRARRHAHALSVADHHSHGGLLSYLWGSSNWLPAYLKESRGFSMREMGWLASLPQYASVAAVSSAA
jgi:MFS family permease